LELVVVNVEPDTTDVVMLGVGVTVEEEELLVDAGEADVVDAGPVELAVWPGTLPESVVGPAPTPADTRPPPVPPTPRETPPLPRDTPIRGSPLELVVVNVTSEDDERLGLWVMVELLPSAVVEAGVVEAVVAESAPPPTPAEMRPPPVPPTPRETPPLPSDTPIRGSPFELVVVKVTSDADVLKLGLWVMVELLLPAVVEADAAEGVVESEPPPTPAEIRPPPVPPTPSDTPPLPSDTPISGSPLELVVVKVTSDADEVRLGLEVMVELLPAAVVEAGVDEGVVEPDPPPTPAEIRPPPVPPRPSDTPPLPSDTPMRGSPLELVVVKVTSDAEVD